MNDISGKRLFAAIFAAVLISTLLSLAITATLFALLMIAYHISEWGYSVSMRWHGDETFAELVGAACFLAFTISWFVLFRHFDGVAKRRFSVDEEIEF